MQVRESLEVAGYVLAKKGRNYIIVKDNDTGVLELWNKRDDYSGFVLEYKGMGYEFAYSISPTIDKN